MIIDNYIDDKLITIKGVGTYKFSMGEFKV